MMRNKRAIRDGMSPAKRDEALDRNLATEADVVAEVRREGSTRSSVVPLYAQLMAAGMAGRHVAWAVVNEAIRERWGIAGESEIKNRAAKRQRGQGRNALKATRQQLEHIAAQLARGEAPTLPPARPRFTDRLLGRQRDRRRGRS